MRASVAWAAVALAISISATDALAEPCPGPSPFADVAPSDFFCTNTEWMKNRGITLGCGDGSIYCPADPVTRAAMAAFMNRLGRALTPVILYSQPGGGAITLPDVPLFPFRCATVDTEAAAYPRQVLFTGLLTGLADANPVAWRAFALVSSDGGATWNTFAPGTSAFVRMSSGPSQWSSTTVIERLDLAPNLPYRFSIGVARDNIVTGTTGNFTDHRCQVAATIYNRNGTTSPLDQE